MDDPPVTLLSDRLGRPVLTHDGRRLGRLTDLTVRLGPKRPRVSRLLIRSGRSTGYLAGWDDVAETTPAGLVLRAGADAVRVDPSHPPLGAEELLLARDVMDTQVVDLRGHRLSRVSDVLLRPSADGLDVVAVDLGIAGLLRRVGLRRLVRHRPALAVDWPDLHLTSRRGHVTQLSAGRANFHRLDAHGLAELLTRLSTGKATDVIRAVDPAHAAAAIHHTHPRTGRRLVGSLSTDERRRLTAAAADDHAHTLTRLGRPASPLRARRFLRTAGWRVHRPPGA